MIALSGIDFIPLIPQIGLLALAGLCGLVLLLALLTRGRGALWRGLALLALLTALANPSIIREDRRTVPDVVALVLDDSPSMAIEQRQAQRDSALAELRRTLEADDSIDLRVITAGQATGEGDDLVDETQIFSVLDQALSDVPRRRMGGVILLSDGQIHDVPDLEDQPQMAQAYGPLHLLLTGEEESRDRRLSLVEAPAFGLVGQSVTVRIRVDDLPESARPQGQRARLQLYQDGVARAVFYPDIGEDYDLELTIGHGGQNVFELEVEPIEGELSLANNRLAVVINGVRDRLRVLLISGEPHAGARTWRNFLKSDPSVDLIHFTILRPPEKNDGTPIDELSLIAFPVHELFVTQLREFDLIIFDRYKIRGILPGFYLENIANYVRRGGALLEAGGPVFVSPLSLYHTPMGQILPGRPGAERLLQGAFRPRLSDLGQRHPVTADLHRISRQAPEDWGRWYQQADLDAVGGSVLMQGLQDRPLLLLDRVGEGRVAQFASDHIWLWSRGYDGGGPHAELLRRVAHWLMKEPELEENTLSAQVSGRVVTLTRRRLEGTQAPIRFYAPGADEPEMISLQEVEPGLYRYERRVDQPGLYRATDEDLIAVAAVGRVNAPELADLRAAPEALRPLMQASGGGHFWLESGSVPHIRRIRPDRVAHGRGWMGLRQNGDYVIDRAAEIALLPPWAFLFLALGALLMAWRREGR